MPAVQAASLLVKVFHQTTVSHSHLVPHSRSSVFGTVPRCHMAGVPVGDLSGVAVATENVPGVTAAGASVPKPLEDPGKAPQRLGKGGVACGHLGGRFPTKASVGNEFRIQCAT